MISLLCRSTKESGTTAKVATHDLSIAEIAERIIELADGVTIDDRDKIDMARLRRQDSES